MKSHRAEIQSGRLSCSVRLKRKRGYRLPSAGYDAAGFVFEPRLSIIEPERARELWRSILWKNNFVRWIAAEPVLPRFEPEKPDERQPAFLARHLFGARLAPLLDFLVVRRFVERGRLD